MPQAPLRAWVITASTKNKPQVVSQSDINTELLPQDIYSGMYARVTINFFGYNTAGKRGVGCGLGNVMKTRDGEPLAGGASAAADFAGVGQTVAAPATPAYGGAMPATPGQMSYPNTGYAAPAPAPAADGVAPWGAADGPYGGQPQQGQRAPFGQPQPGQQGSTIPGPPRPDAPFFLSGPTPPPGLPLRSRP